MASRSKPPPLPYPDPLDDVSLWLPPLLLPFSIADRRLFTTGAPSTEPTPRFLETVPRFKSLLPDATAPSTSSVTAGVDGEIGGVGVRPRLDVLRAVFGRFLPDEPPDVLPPSEPAAAAETVVPSERASSSAAESWNHLARHCCAVRPVSILLMLLHLGPRDSWRDMSFLSSGSVHASFLTLGSRWRRQRPMHCWSVRPSRCLAISAHRWPCCS
mmetsp:Transcript_13821/g.60355  ORF Transcript_13821/g.60355 Transcript_13821/m.60355 type:complete len:214 (-) Transcript_13821:497-1138(-)